MRDELYDRDYQLGRAELHEGMDRLVLRIGKGIADTFEAMHRIEWSAPWRAKSKNDCAGLA